MAVNFFEKYEQAARKYRETLGSIIFKLPAAIVTGYIDGMRRAQYLREIARLR